MRTWLLLIAVIGMNCVPALCEDEPTIRPEWTQGLLDKVLGISLEDKIIEQAGKVEQSREKWKSIPLDYHETEGFLWWKRSPKKEALRELVRHQETLEGLLASTPSDANKPKYMMIKEEGGKGKEANTEIIEITLAMRNLRNVRKQLMIDPSNLESAKKYYDTHVTCMLAIIDMHEDLIKNIDAKYVPAIEKRKKSVVERLVWIEKRMQQDFESETNRNMLEESKVGEERFLKVLENVLATQLPELRGSLKKRTPKLHEDLQMARFLRDQVEDRKEVKALFEDFTNNYKRLAESPPQLIRFEQDWSDFELPKPKS
jgi:hypothetical protein